MYLVARGKQGEVLDTGVAGVQSRGGENDVEYRVCLHRDAQQGLGAD